jgi:asparagine synthase (glutamine-hydrolysing)
MCGIAGIISRDVSKVNDIFLNRMGNTLAHRGPDGQATWTSGDGIAGFCHRRLIIIDTSAAAAQPMHYPGGYTIVHNGEIYNYIELRDELRKKGYQFKTSSDTEVILAAYAEYKERCVEHFDGMFAFAIWDANEKTLFCARDRFGEKPFYYSLDNAFCFASEIKALQSTAVNSYRDNGMLLYFFGTGNTVDPSDSSRTFYRYIKKLPAAHWLLYNARTAEVKIARYWDVSKKTVLKSVNGAIDELGELLTVSIKRRLRSDVPLGTSLSGGLDSSCIARCLWALGVRDLKTFTASFPGFERDETASAKKVAAQLDFGNYIVQPTADGFVNEFEKLVYHQDEPIASASVYAQFKVFELAAGENVTVLLDGQGADEVLAGYDHYRRWWMKSLFPRFTRDVLRLRTKRTLLDKSLNGEFANAAIKELNIVKPVVRRLNDLLYFDTFCSGLEQLLRYADRNSMAHGREVRLPFLNYELVDFIFSLPGSIKIHNGYTKWILRKLMSHKLPDEIVWAKRKTGFEPPQKKWMKHPEVQSYIRNAKEKLVSDGILDKIVLDQRSNSSDAFDRHAREWRWMAAAAFISNKVPENKKGV